MMKIKRLFLFLFILGSFWGQEELHAASSAVSQKCRDFAFKNLVYGQSLIQSDLQPHWLEWPQSTRLIRSFYSGLTYKLVACGDQSFSRLKLTIYDQQGVAVRESEDQENFPVIYFEPEQTGKYFIKVHADGGSGYYSLLIFAR
ncbi:MAG: hypothetical protein COB67_02830 [SAR324 cluster bacterium]|uniref:Peptidase C-terminal archaeal/bacterial domain-containing protein n=1 Tax=SAR324 cluster bacterium TaxID=2024889 RepID=A0A2A4T8Z2_9DELT|nr:MAG: hypothetical protein COB67_02830 [SAR324 cluster bacterium]